MTFFPWKLPKFLLLMVQMLGCQNAQIQKVQVKVKMKSASVFTKMQAQIYVCVCYCTGPFYQLLWIILRPLSPSSGLIVVLTNKCDPPGCSTIKSSLCSLSFESLLYFYSFSLFGSLQICLDKLLFYKHNLTSQS